ncbi:hypothetical protein SAMN05444851_1737 [Aliiroseovarius sediminilitoris]|uniref:Uncharacterized protein n=1 Tax=Aliiroseovarius sediminilitoris TaxID=1173584 RepID=A0A1I0PLU6_9RHOB|nr:hypothetical protein SAMN05444851_1737 [Aliiroseovarius sediminilitoris]
MTVFKDSPPASVSSPFAVLAGDISPSELLSQRFLAEHMVSRIRNFMLGILVL